eukprot:TRINITY_DN11149_c0_g4_i1.p1 TRINITY_DN11149_c0_g4~~TRINITY_DN11149_c0_g4_i1.p1  ORF type:complete len:1102 (+),score=408.28 TRINITY_DN11149_c0_g4_i1:76-3381(+)
MASIGPPTSAADLRDLLRCRGVPKAIVSLLAKRDVDCAAFLKLTDDALDDIFDISDPHARAQLLRCQQHLKEKGPEAFAHECYTESMTSVAARLEDFYAKNGVQEKKGKAMGIVVSYGDDPKLLLDALTAKYEAKTKELSFLKDWVKDHERRQKRLGDLQKKLEQHFKKAGDPVMAGKAAGLMQSYSDDPAALKSELLQRWPAGGDAGWCDDWAREVATEQGWKRRKDDAEARRREQELAEALRRAEQDAAAGAKAVADQERAAAEQLRQQAAAGLAQAAAAQKQREQREAAAREEDRRRREAEERGKLEKAERGARKAADGAEGEGRQGLLAEERRLRAAQLDKEERERASAEERRAQTEAREKKQRKALAGEEGEARAAAAQGLKDGAAEAERREAQRHADAAAARAAAEAEADRARESAAAEEAAARGGLLRAQRSEQTQIAAREEQHRQQQIAERRAAEAEEERGRAAAASAEDAAAAALLRAGREERGALAALEQLLREQRGELEGGEGRRRATVADEEERLWEWISGTESEQRYPLLLRLAVSDGVAGCIAIAAAEQEAWGAIVAAERRGRTEAAWEHEAREWRCAEARGLLGHEERAARTELISAEAAGRSALLLTEPRERAAALAAAEAADAEDAALRQLEDEAVAQRERELAVRSLQVQARSAALALRSLTALEGAEQAGRRALAAVAGAELQWACRAERAARPAPPPDPGPDWASVAVSQVAGLRQREQAEWRRAVSSLGGGSPRRIPSLSASSAPDSEEEFVRHFVAVQGERLERLERVLRHKQGLAHPPARDPLRTPPLSPAAAPRRGPSGSSPSSLCDGDAWDPEADPEERAARERAAGERAEEERRALWQAVRADAQSSGPEAGAGPAAEAAALRSSCAGSAAATQELAEARERLDEATGLGARLAVLLCRVLADAPRCGRGRSPGRRRVCFAPPPHRLIRTPPDAGGALPREQAELAAWFARRLASAGLVIDSPVEAQRVAAWLLEGSAEVLARRPSDSAAALMSMLRAEEAARARPFAGQLRALSAVAGPLPAARAAEALAAAARATAARRGRTGLPLSSCGARRFRSASPCSADSTYGAGRMSP